MEQGTFFSLSYIFDEWERKKKKTQGESFLFIGMVRYGKHVCVRYVEETIYTNCLPAIFFKECCGFALAYTSSSDVIYFGFCYVRLKCGLRCGTALPYFLFSFWVCNAQLKPISYLSVENQK